MLLLHTTEFAYDHRHELYRALSERIAQQKKAILLVPEQQTLQVEKEAAQRLSPNAPLYFEVSNFSRLANTAFRTVGGLSEVYSDTLAKHLLMWRALTEAAPLLTRRTQPSVGAGEVTDALRAVSEMQALGMDDETLANAAKNDTLGTSSRLQGKLHDLSVISTLFRRLHNERFADVGEDVGALARILRQHTRLFDETAFYIDGFTSFTEPQLLVLSELIGRHDTTVYITLPKADADAFEYTETQRTAQRLLHMADLASTKKRKIYSVGNTRIKNDGLYEISRSLWRINAKIDKNSLQNIEKCLKIYETDTPHDASELVASFIKKAVMEGASYRDIAIIMRHADTYLGIVDTALKEADIPFFVSRRKDITAFEAAKLIDTAYRIILGGYKREDVLAYAKCGILGIDTDACDRFELYTEKWQITGQQFLREGIWNMNPDGYTDRWRDGAEALLHDIDRTRKALLAPLSDLAARAQDAHTVREHATALLQFLLDIRVSDTLNERAMALRACGEDTSAEENERLFSVLCDILQRMVDIMGDHALDTRAFHTLFGIACASVDMGRIPSYADCVTVGSADMLRLSDKRHVILFGVNDGEFPSAVCEDSWFTEREKQLLYSVGLVPEPDEHVKSARELFIFSRAFTAASDTVTLIATRRNAAFQPQKRASVIARIIEASHGTVQVTDARSLSVAQSVYTPAAALARLSDETLSAQDKGAICAALTRTPLAVQTLIGSLSILNDALTLSADTAATLYGKDMAMTQSRLEQFTLCPLQHFCNYVLHLDDNRRASFDAMSIGTFVHSILEHFFRRISEEGEDLRTLSTAVCRSRVEEIAKEHIRRVQADNLQDTVRMRHFLGRLTRTAATITEGIVEELQNSRFTPRFFELPIEKDDPTSPAPVVCQTSDGHGVYIYGTIDRVDTFADGEDVFVRVIDYKTGRKKFTPSDLREGQNLQMFLYLRAVTESESFRSSLGVPREGRVLPAGVIYVGTHLSDQALSSPSQDAVASFKKGQTRSGMLLDDPRSIAAMNPDHLPIRLKKDGTPDSRSKDKLYTEEGWHTLCDTVTQSVVRIAERMKEGAIPAEPLRKKQAHAVCDCCAYKPVCRNARVG